MAALFSPGQVVATPGALEALHRAKTLPLSLLQRHLSGDWGDIDQEDRAENEYSLTHGFRLHSNYPLETGERVWVITEHDRSATTLLLPSEY